jgi:hypothetical protein
MIPSGRGTHRPPSSIPQSLHGLAPGLALARCGHRALTTATIDP